ncbi:MAG: elongation factor P maturation arginine rhamnosyltransferase EarP [Burkholderiales bacterium]
MNTLLPLRWDIFCRVIDNFGDIGVSWRLARQLVSEHGLSVRLWVDQMASLHALCPQVDADATRQVVEGVVVFQLADESGFSQPADVVIEAFGCGLPEKYVSAMVARKTKPLWIVLEYLSAEPWVREHHGLPSPHPQLDLRRYFFFPGISEGTGGVLCEADLLARRAAFDAAAKRAWWARMGFDDVPPQALSVSLFAYPHAPVQALLAACAASTTPVVVAIPEGPLAQRVRGEFPRRSGNLELRFVPFVPQADYDALLWACDINFVRGEDSFVRAQWAGRPFVWHIYPQAENAHVAKLNAFLDVYTSRLSAPAAQAVRGLWHVWNGVDGAPPFADAWYAFSGQLPAQRRGLSQWEEGLRGVGDLTGNLVRFCQKMI